MAIYQINLFVCDSCGKTDTVLEEPSLYSDPLVSNIGWGWHPFNGDTNQIYCPECLEGFKSLSNEEPNGEKQA